VAQLPLPGRSGADPVLIDGAAFAIPDLPPAPRAALGALMAAGHEAVLVGGSLRDLLRGERPEDWDIATSARPEEVSALFPGSSWENRFGTVTLPGQDHVEITTYRSESGYADRRRPDEVVFHRSLRDDLARRDVTVNAIGWLPDAPGATTGRLVDPHGGLDDLRAGRIRAVGNPADRFAEDALRVLRTVRFALRFGFAVDPATEAALREAAPTTTALSAERIRDELRRLLADPGIRPTLAFGRWEDLGILAVLLPELAALRGVPQGKPIPGDALDHSLRTADALPAQDPILRLTGLLHDLGKATTLADGHFIGHEVVGARMAEDAMRRLRFPAPEVARVRDLVRHHMFAYEPAWTDAAVRRFIKRVGAERLEDLFALRVADDVASGAEEPSVGGLDELRRRVEEQRHAPMSSWHLAIDGHDLQREIGMAPGPPMGRLLDRLVEAVLDEPARNRREVLLELARSWLASGDGAHHREGRDPGPEG
jgi:tRNA nucleotidyltransferase/poly(A) polymerase